MFTQGSLNKPALVFLIKNNQHNHQSMFLKLWFAILVLPLSISLNGQQGTYIPGASTPNHAKHSLAGRSGYCDSVNIGIISKDTLKGSPIRLSSFNQSGINVQIAYGSPGVRGRNIWGGLVAFNEVWVTGAHNATKLSITRPFLVEGVRIDTGTYALFTIPGEENWIIIINKNYQQHLADDYDAKDDIVRVTIKPVKTNKLVQRLTYEIKRVNRRSIDFNIIMSWENLSIWLPLNFKD